MTRNARPQLIRILGGDLRGRSIAVPPGMDVRPTAARTREALFNLLLHGGYGPDGGNILAGARVLDLCCGTGALAFEALSRGAANATLADQDRRVLRMAEQNAEALGMADRCRFLNVTLPAGLPAGPFDLVFLDPPYAAGLTEPILQRLVVAGVLTKGGIAVVEMAASDAVSVPPDLGEIDNRRYGAARLRILRRG